MFTLNNRKMLKIKIFIIIKRSNAFNYTKEKMFE